MNSARASRLRYFLPRSLFLVALALMGAALWVRSRVPRPVAQGDKWFWERGETALSLGADLAATAPSKSKLLHLPLTRDESLRLTNREGIRSLLRAFEGVTWRKMRPGETTPNYPIFAYLDLALPGNQGVSIEVFVKDGRYFIHGVGGYGSGAMAAVAQPSSGPRFLKAFRDAVLKAQHGEPGYTLSPLTPAAPAPTPTVAPTPSGQRPKPGQALKSAQLPKSGQPSKPVAA